MNGDWIRTYTGKKFYFANPTPEQIDPVDIAHALSNICRFNGHIKRFYSVLHHSINVAQLLPPALYIHGLLHDAAEAYVCDLPSPIKRYFPDYQKLEEELRIVINKRFNLFWNHHIYATVNTADLLMLAREKLNLLDNSIDSWETRLKEWSVLEPIYSNPENMRKLQSVPNIQKRKKKDLINQFLAAIKSVV